MNKETVRTERMSRNPCRPVRVHNSSIINLGGAADLQKVAEALSKPTPTAKIAGMETSQQVADHVVKEKARLDKIAAVLRGMVGVREDITSTIASGASGSSLVSRHGGPAT